MPLCIWVEDLEVRLGHLRWRACVGVVEEAAEPWRWDQQTPPPPRQGVPGLLKIKQQV